MQKSAVIVLLGVYCKFAVEQTSVSTLSVVYVSVLCQSVFDLQFAILLFASFRVKSVIGYLWDALISCFGQLPCWNWFSCLLGFVRFFFAYLCISDLHVCCVSFPPECVSLLEKRSAVILRQFKSSCRSHSLGSFYVPVST